MTNTDTPMAATPLFAELHRWARTPFIWGEADCALVCCDWVVRVRGVDPGASLRLAYGTAGELQRLTGFFTDPLAATTPLMAAAGLDETPTPGRGDVGLLMYLTDAGSARPHMALCLGAHWAVKAEAGVTTYQPGKVLRAWAVGYVDP